MKTHRDHKFVTPCTSYAYSSCHQITLDSTRQSASSVFVLMLYQHQTQSANRPTNNPPETNSPNCTGTILQKQRHWHRRYRMSLVSHRALHRIFKQYNIGIAPNVINITLTNVNMRDLHCLSRSCNQHAQSQNKHRHQTKYLTTKLNACNNASQ